MATYEKLNGAISLLSNSPGVPTGYGMQAKHLVEKFTRHGIKTAALSNYGLEGSRSKIQTKHGPIDHYPKGWTVGSYDVAPAWYQDFKNRNPGVKHVGMILYDVWMYNTMEWTDPLYAWVPLDHITMPPDVHRFLLRDNVHPIAMSPHGQRELERIGVDAPYVPHVIDTTVMKPTKNIDGMPTRKFMGVPDDAFLVTMVTANKANGHVHRKALAEQLFAFSMFRRQYPDSYLYLHTQDAPLLGGYNLKILLQAVGLDESSVIVADQHQLIVGYPEKALAAIYTASDVLLSATYGEGFGVPVIEAQACGTKVIASNWAATQDLVSESSWLVEGQPFWDNPQSSFYQIPLIPSIVGALKMAYESERGTDQVSIDFAKQFETEKVWNESWLPLWRKVFS